MKKTNRIIGMILCLVLALSLTACGQSAPDSIKDAQSANANPSKYTSAQSVLDEENQILNASKDLWDKVFLSMSKENMADILADNYGDVLKIAAEKIKDQFTDEEFQKLMDDAQQIRQLEEILATMPSEEAPASAASTGVFPSFTGKDFDGNDVDSSLFEKNAFTVVNFWFNECSPCVGELGDLNELNEKVKEQGGEVIGVNIGALDGNEKTIEAAKKLLEAKGASYRNIYFDASSEAGTFALNILAFPTTYVVVRNGNLVGDPIMGGINNANQMAQLQKNIDAALAQ